MSKKSSFFSPPVSGLSPTFFIFCHLRTRNVLGKLLELCAPLSVLESFLCQYIREYSVEPNSCNIFYGSLLNGHLGCLQFFTILNNTAVSAPMHELCVLVAT